MKVAGLDVELLSFEGYAVQDSEEYTSVSCVVDETQAITLRGKPGWVDSSLYSNTGRLVPGEIGAYRGVRIRVLDRDARARVAMDGVIQALGL